MEGPQRHITRLHTDVHDKITLTLLDSLYRGSKTEMIFLFNKSRSERELALLKLCLEKTLWHYYPYTGKLVDNASTGLVDLSWEDAEANGAVYEEYEDDAETSLSFEPDFLQSERLQRYYPSSSDATLVSIRVTNFRRVGGLIIGVSLSHAVGDGTTSFDLLTRWWKLTNANSNLVDSSNDLTLSAIVDLKKEDCVEVVTDRELFSTESKDAVRPDALSYLPSTRGEFFSFFKKNGNTFRICSLPLRTKVIARYQLRARENNIKITENDVICAMIFRSYVLAAPALCADPDRIVLCGFPINIRGRRKVREMPRGYVGNSLILARISVRVGDILTDTSLTYLGQQFRAESVRWYDSNNIESYLSWLQNTEEKGKVFFQMDTTSVLSSWTGFPLYTNTLFGERPSLAGPMFPFPEFENTKFCATPNGDGIRIFASVFTEKYDEFLRNFALMSAEDCDVQ